MGSLLKIKHGHMHKSTYIYIEILRLALDARFHQNNGVNVFKNLKFKN